MNQSAIKALCEKMGIDPLQTAERERNEKYAPTVKPGTRCECRGHDCCRSGGGHDGGAEHYRCGPMCGCHNDAVRMVTVRERVECSGKLIDGGTVPPMAVNVEKTVPLCAACYGHHASLVVQRAIGASKATK